MAGYKLGLNSLAELPWEYPNQMRSGIQPLMVFSFTKVCWAVGINNPFTITLFLRLAHSLFSFFACWWLFKIFVKKIDSPVHRQWLAFLTVLLWCIPYFHARLSSENLSASLFIIALCLYLKEVKTNNLVNTLLIGLFLGLSVVVRFQAGFMVFGFGMWLLFIQREKLVQLTTMFLGIVLAVGLGFIIDYWFYGEWTCSAWNYLNLNIIQGKVANFGKEPWYFFISEGFIKIIPPLSLFVFAGFASLWIFKPKHVLTWLTLPYVFIHFFVVHKELRFLFPLINFLPIILILFFQEISERQETSKFFNKLYRINPRYLIIPFMILNSGALLVASLKASDNHISTTKFLYENYNKPTNVLFTKVDPLGLDIQLHYYTKPYIQTINILSDDSIEKFIDSKKGNLWLSEEFYDESIIKKGNYTYKKVYCNLPEWVKHVNVNNFLARTHIVTLFEISKNDN